MNYDIDGIELLKKAEKIDDDVNLGAERVLDNGDLKKIRILQLKEGVRRVDRHGFRDDKDGIDAAMELQQESAKQALRDEYFHKMQELLRLKRGLPPKGYLTGMDNSDYDDEEMADEEGEEDCWEVENGEEIMLSEDDDQDEYVSDKSSDSDVIPQLIPIMDDVINNERPEEESDIDFNDLDFGESSSEYNSDDLDPNSTENPHGFVFSNMLETYSKTRRDRIEEMRELKDAKAHRDKFKKKKSSKKIGKSEKVH